MVVNTKLQEFVVHLVYFVTVQGFQKIDILGLNEVKWEGIEDNKCRDSDNIFQSGNSRARE